MYEVLVDDNFHFTDESERYSHGTFATAEEAVAACKAIVESAVRDIYDPEASAEALFESYCHFGEDPFVVARGDGEPRVEFSAWTYAREFCERLVAARPSKP
jgi:hypothetical protein